MRYKPTQRDPPRRIHMHMVLVLDVLVVHFIRLNAIRRMPRAQEEDEFVLEILRELGNGSAGFGTDRQDLAQVGFGFYVCLEAVFVAALFFAYLTVPSESTQACVSALISGDEL